MSFTGESNFSSAPHPFSLGALCPDVQLFPTAPRLPQDSEGPAQFLVGRSPGPVEVSRVPQNKWQSGCRHLPRGTRSPPPFSLHGPGTTQEQDAVPCLQPSSLLKHSGCCSLWSQSVPVCSHQSPVLWATPRETLLHLHPGDFLCGWGNSWAGAKEWSCTMGFQAQAGWTLGL